MERRVTGIYLAVLLIGFAYAFFAMYSSKPVMDGRIEEMSEVLIWDDTMEAEQQDGSFLYRRTLPQEDIQEKVIVYRTVHMYLEVFIGGDMVYELKEGEGQAVHTAGFCWNTISLSEEDAGKEIVFQVTPAYADGKPNGSFYYGTYKAIEQRIFKEHFLPVVLAGMILLAGVVMFIYGLFVVKKGSYAETIIQFAIFSTMLGIWSVGETQVLDWFFPSNMILVSLSHLMLMTMPIPFVLYLRNMYSRKESRLWDACCYLNCVVIVLRLLLQLAGVRDLRETLLLTHIYLLLFVACVVIMTIREVMENEMTRQIKVNCVGVMVILASTVLELVLFRFGNMSVPLGSMGFLFYVIAMGIENVRRSRKLMEQARESELYRKLAFTDELTGLSNRTAFREDMEYRMGMDPATGEEKIKPTVVYMFDLNDLKKCNDNYGHDNGDKYIKMAANAIKALFEKDGKCYRIGGDEFCAWAPYVSQEEIDGKLQQLEQEVRAFNEKGFVVTASIAAGYAVYEESMDGSGLHSTMKRADAMMYERKQAYKKDMKQN